MILERAAPFRVVHIEGPGMITQYDRGIQFDGFSDCHVEQVNCIYNNEMGLCLKGSTNNHVNDNVFDNNGLYGMDLTQQSRDNHVNNNETKENVFIGIRVQLGSTDNHINGNTALVKDQFDLADVLSKRAATTTSGGTIPSAAKTCSASG